MKAKSWFYHLMSREQGSNHSWDLRLTCSFFSFNFLLSASFPRTVVTSFGQSLCLQKRCNKCHSGMNIYTNEQKHGTGKLQKFEARPTDYVWSGRGIKLLSSIWRLDVNTLYLPVGCNERLCFWQTFCFSTWIDISIRSAAWEISWLSCSGNFEKASSKVGVDISFPWILL